MVQNNLYKYLKSTIFSESGLLSYSSMYIAGLGTWNVRLGLIGCRSVEMCRGLGRNELSGAGRLGQSVWMMIWNDDEDDKCSISD